MVMAPATVSAGKAMIGGWGKGQVQLVKRSGGRGCAGYVASRDFSLVTLGYMIRCAGMYAWGNYDEYPGHFEPSEAASPDLSL